MLNMNLRLSFKDDIPGINMNECGHWGHGPIWNKCTVGVNYRHSNHMTGFRREVWFQSQINKSQLNTCPI